jgi:hypothetical protein
MTNIKEEVKGKCFLSGIGFFGWVAILGVLLILSSIILEGINPKNWEIKEEKKIGNCYVKERWVSSSQKMLDQMCESSDTKLGLSMWLLMIGIVLFLGAGVGGK